MLLGINEQTNAPQGLLLRGIVLQLSSAFLCCLPKPAHRLQE